MPYADGEFHFTSEHLYADDLALIAKSPQETMLSHAKQCALLHRKMALQPKRVRDQEIAIPNYS